MPPIPQFTLVIPPPLDEHGPPGQRSPSTGGEPQNATLTLIQTDNHSDHLLHSLPPLSVYTGEQGARDARGGTNQQVPGQYLTVPDGSSRHRRRSREQHRHAGNKSQGSRKTTVSASRTTKLGTLSMGPSPNIQGHHRADLAWEFDLVKNFAHPVFGRPNVTGGAGDIWYGEAAREHTTAVQAEVSGRKEMKDLWREEAMAAIDLVATRDIKGTTVAGEVVGGGGVRGSKGEGDPVNVGLARSRYKNRETYSGYGLCLGMGEDASPASGSLSAEAAEAEGDEAHLFSPTPTFNRFSPSRATSPALNPSQRFVKESRIGVGHTATTKLGELRRAAKGFHPMTRGSSNFAAIDSLEKPTNKFNSIKGKLSSEGNENGKSSEFLAQPGVDEEIINISAVPLSFTSSPDRGDRTIPDAAAANQETAHRKSNRLSRLFGKLKTDGLIEGQEAVLTGTPSDRSESKFWPKLKRATSQRSLKASVQQKWNSMRGH